MRENLAKFHSGLERHVQQAQRFPLLRPDEERRLAQHWRTTQDAAAAERLLGSETRVCVETETHSRALVNSGGSELGAVLSIPQEGDGMNGE